ncbi:hypothetical protein PPACK8108_LOCUS2449 [Phakopsora pachyrhizi]|uniref:Uncharacterized protein n=1 Tax=Phakopsora pachyrhizi TaxID=170000 RepID=A0AAV0AHX9_PHAPC|nr:hypothetical protein PPACK8108_LOCUS2449 [Phakopsora pachyrhizi]
MATAADSELGQEAAVPEPGGGSSGEGAVACGDEAAVGGGVGDVGGDTFGRAGSELSDPELEHRSTSNLLGPFPGCLEKSGPGCRESGARGVAEIPGSERGRGGSVRTKENKEGKEGVGGVLTNTLCLLPVTPVSGNVVSRARPCIGAFDIVVEVPFAAKTDHWFLRLSTTKGESMVVRLLATEGELLVVKFGVKKSGRNPGGEILPGAQKSGQIFDSCPGSGRKMAFLEFSGRNFLEEQVLASKGGDHALACVLDWIRAGLSEDRRHKEGGYGWRGESWIGDDGDIIRAGGGCGGRIGKGGQEKGGAERGFCWISQDFEEEGVAVEENGWHHWKEEQKLGGGAHQGQSGWSKTTGATDFFKEAPDLEGRIQLVVLRNLHLKFRNKERTKEIHDLRGNPLDNEEERPFEKSNPEDQGLMKWELKIRGRYQFETEFGKVWVGWSRVVMTLDGKAIARAYEFLAWSFEAQPKSLRQRAAS